MRYHHKSLCEWITNSGHPCESLIPDIEKINKADYPDAVTEELVSRFGGQKARQLMQGGHCGKITEMAHRLQKAYRDARSLGDFAKLHNEINPHVTGYVSGRAFYLSYPTCYCPHVRDLDLSMPEVWCGCTVGWVKTVYGFIFAKEINPILMESVKQGNDRCLIRIDL